MNVILATSVPIILIALGFFTLRFGGKKELLKMDLVQFLYAFVLTPAVIIWIKTVVFYNLKNELGVSLNVEDTFLIDTVVTLISLYIFSFVVIHSLTKSFQLRKDKEPLFDIFNRSEYFHQWLSHLITYSGGLLLMLFLGTLNLFVPLTMLTNKRGLYLLVFIGIIFGFLFYIAMLIYKAKEQRRFDRAIKFQIYIYTFILLTSYLIVRPNYSVTYAMFWCSAFFFVTAAVSSQALRRGHRKH